MARLEIHVWSTVNRLAKMSAPRPAETARRLAAGGQGPMVAKAFFFLARARIGVESRSFYPRGVGWRRLSHFGCVG